MRYTLQLNTTTGSPQWSAEIDLASDTMAIDYARKVVAHNMRDVRWFMSATLWRHVNADEVAFVATLRLKPLNPEALVLIDKETP